MERESFENEATAQILNDNFVSIKVDREERCAYADVAQGGSFTEKFAETGHYRKFNASLTSREADACAAGVHRTDVDRVYVSG